MFVKITISEDNAKKLYEVDESKRQEALYKLYKSVKPEALLYERPEEESIPGTFVLVINVDDINALYRRPDYERAMKKALSSLYVKAAREKFGPTEEEKKKAAAKAEKEKVAGTKAPSPIKEVETIKIKKERKKGETPVVYVIPDTDPVTSGTMVFYTVTDCAWEREYKLSTKKFHDELEEEFSWTDEAITEIEDKLHKLGFVEKSPSYWIITGPAGEKVKAALGTDLKKILEFINSKKILPFIFEYMELPEEDEEDYEEEDDEEEEEGVDLDGCRDLVTDMLDSLSKSSDSIGLLKDLKIAIENKLKEWGA